MCIRDRFCFDGDSAGEKAAWRALENTLPLMEDGRRIKFLFLPSGEDPDSYVRSIGQDQFSRKVSSAKPLEDFLFEKLATDLDTNSIEGKARLSNLAKKHIRKIPAGVYARLMLERLSELVGVPAESIEQLYSRNTSDGEGQSPKSANTPGSELSNRHPTLRTPQNGKISFYQKPASIKAIELLLQKPEIALSINRDLKPLRSAEDEGRKLLISLIEMIQVDPKIDVFALLGYCYGSNLGNQLTRIFRDEKITPTEGVEDEFVQIMDNILSDIHNKLELLRLKTELRSRVSGGD